MSLLLSLHLHLAANSSPTRCRCSSSWPSVVLAFTLRYPSPITPHIVSVDTLSRTINLQTGQLVTDRIILKKGAASALPKWFPKSILGKTESWIYERSCIDPKRGRMEVLTRNLDHRTVMDVQEDLWVTRDASDVNNATLFDTYVSVTSSVNFSLLRSRIESFGINRYTLSVERARASLSSFINLLRHPMHRATLLQGNPPPLSAMLAPALGETFARWEETASGFSGHGFDDRQKERYVPDIEAVANAPARLNSRMTATQWVEWARDRRRGMVEQASEKMRGIRANWFGWRLRMKEVEHEHEGKKDTESLEQTSQQQMEQQTDGGPKKRRSWVWQWSRNKP